MSLQPQTGKKIENYVFNYNDFLGNGNFSKCYKATNIHTQEQVAIKIVELNSLKSKKLQELLYSQIEVLKSLNHPNVLRCLEVFTSNRNCYIVTELCGQGDLQNILKTRKKFDDIQIQKIIKDVYKGLLYLASKGIIHRDLKIANVFMKNGVAKIADFGFACPCKQNFTDLNIGSPLYMSPEGILHNIYGPKSDVWAFGILVYELYSATTPFNNCKSQNELKMCVMKPIEWNQLKQQIPNEAKELILTCIQINQQKRPYVHELQKLQFLTQNNRRQNNEVIFPLQFQTFTRMPPRLQNDSMTRNRNKPRSHNTFKVQNNSYRSVDRFNQPQRIPFQGTSVNTSLNLQQNKHVFSNSQNYNQTISNPCQSPQIRKQYTTPHVTSPINTSFHHQSLNSPPNLSQYITKSKNNQPKIKNKILIICQVTFKECVSILHYCRLVFKYLQIFKELNNLKDPFQKKHYTILGLFLQGILQELFRQIINKKVKYQGQNPEIRERKLNQVTDQYRKKYTKELNQQLQKTNISQDQRNTISIKRARQAIEQALAVIWIPQQSTPKQIITAQLLLTISNSTILLEECYHTKNYHKLTKNKQIQDILNKNKNDFTYNSYIKRKNKLENRRN